MNRRDFLTISTLALAATQVDTKAKEMNSDDIFHSVFKMVCTAHHTYKIDIEGMYISTPLYCKMWDTKDGCVDLLRKIPKNLWEIPCEPKDLIGNIVVVYGKKGLIYFKDINNPTDFVVCMNGAEDE
jgi:hypothetical protein